MTRVMNILKSGWEIVGLSVVGVWLIAAPIGTILGGLVLSAQGDYGLGAACTFCGVMMIYRFFKDQKDK